MSGPIVRTGTTPKFWENWDQAFGKSSGEKKGGDKKATAKEKAPKAAGEKKAGKKKSAKKVKK